MNKPNCSTCINAGAKSDPARGFYKCKATGEFLWKTQFELICRYGCFFHHGAREYLMQDVIEYLEQYLITETFGGYSETDVAYSKLARETISLIRGDGK